MKHCTCGKKFVPFRTGELLIKNGLLYSVDSFQCPTCKKTILGSIPAVPICEADSEKADRIIQAMADKGYNVYGN